MCVHTAVEKQEQLQFSGDRCSASLSPGSQLWKRNHFRVVKAATFKVGLGVWWGVVKGQAATLDAPRCLHSPVGYGFLAWQLNSSLLTFQYKTECAPSCQCSPCPAGATKCRCCLHAVGKARRRVISWLTWEAWPISRDFSTQFIISLIVPVVVRIYQCFQSATPIAIPLLSI